MDPLLDGGLARRITWTPAPATSTSRRPRSTLPGQPLQRRRGHRLAHNCNNDPAIKSGQPWSSDIRVTQDTFPEPSVLIYGAAAIAELYLSFSTKKEGDADADALLNLQEGHRDLRQHQALRQRGEQRGDGRISFLITSDLRAVNLLAEAESVVACKALNIRT